MLKKYSSLLICSVVVFGLNITPVHSQPEAIQFPPEIKHAIELETRTDSGKPGKAYWQNFADYKIDATFNPNSLEIRGIEEIFYKNNSPDTLHSILVHIFPDIFREGTVAEFYIDANDKSSGVELESMLVNSEIVNLDPASGNCEYDDTYLWVDLLRPILPESENNIKISWNYTLNETSHMRTGQVDSSSFFIAYWFPRVGVYDDINGWNNYNYTGTAEFYNDFGNFDVNITVPGGFVVFASGELQNPQFTLANKYYLRYKQAKESFEKTKIIEAQDIPHRDFTVPDPEIAWHFKASNVSDFAFALSDHYVWDAIMLNNPGGHQPITLNVAYDHAAPNFAKVIQIAKRSIEYMINDLPGIPFPYPAMTVFNGLDEMEYPMIVNDIGINDIKSTFSLTAHEICHTYFPFYTGCNEREYAWMDEGLVSFFEYSILRDIFDPDYISLFFLDDYVSIMGTSKDLPLIVSSELIKSEYYYALSYSKAAMFYSILQNEMGKDAFKKMLGDFAEVWQGKHPTGFDFLYFIHYSSENGLSWLIQPWFFEYGFVDLAIESVERNSDTYEVKVIRKGNLPAPVNLQLIYTDGTANVIRGKALVWKNQVFNTKIEVSAEKEIKSFEVFQDMPMDLYPDDNIFYMK
ncbi:MAG: M1 family metallopeptidase [Bacteroidales bacterium]|nr:M1 family metallopeptidase [Bacteroidales bacterium]MCF8404773.1 M1 family metallopeptidase [Bacteroidales bacterium]